MFTSVAALQLEELANPKLDDAESLHYEFWHLTLIVITAFCCIFGLWISGAAKVLCLVVSFCQGFARGRWKKAGIRASKRNWVVSKTSNGSCNVCGDNSDFMRLPNGNVAEKPEHQLLVTQPGASIMEQLVPEITQHMLSYLDYRSLCNVSMTNSCMQRAANDDSAWKALFQKDFTMEQTSTVVPCGWKAHYAVTKAVLEANKSFYRSFHAKSIKGMSCLWLHSDYVKCIHPGGELLSGYEAIMESWRSVLSWRQNLEFDLQEERARVFGNMAWVTVKVFINSSAEPLFTTNVYEFHDGQWYMVHHHSSPQLVRGNFEFGPFPN